jgi:hypothetical protein
MGGPSNTFTDRAPRDHARPRVHRGPRNGFHHGLLRRVRIYAYVLKVDSGFAPNPFHGWCTLACCKPAIRRTARRGDWVVGITPRAQGNRIAYAMRVDESLTFEECWSDPRFRAKRPARVVGAPIVERCGDNCHEPLGGGSLRQVRGSGHWGFNRYEPAGHLTIVQLEAAAVAVARRLS